MLRGKHMLVIFLLFHFTNGDLYTENDPIILLDGPKFDTTVFHQENAWLIQFYNAWCGHCAKFAPKFKLFASEVQNWQSTVKVAAINCAADENHPKCREYNIRMYPTLRVFGANISEHNRGKSIEIAPTQIKEMKECLVHHLKVLQRYRNGSKTWTNLQPYYKSDEKIFTSLSPDIEQVFIISQPKGAWMAQAVALDFSFAKNAYITYRETVGKATNSVSMKIIQRGQTPIHLTSIRNTTEAISDVIASRLNISEEDKPKPAESYQDETEASLPSKEEKESPTISFHKPDIVYMVDIENALSYAITHEIVSAKLIDGKAMESLKLFLEAVNRYLPMRPSVRNFMKKFTSFVDSKKVINGRDLSTKIDLLNKGESTMPKHRPWIGCAGSRPHFRGYPCGLWVTFHALTVNAALEQDEALVENPILPLQAIHGYIKYFFGCTYCSRHFQTMFNIDAEDFVHTPEDNLIWLWKSHNKVNKRLAGEVTEDPLHKKEPFPSPRTCSPCWIDKSFDETQVIIYLKRLYNKEFFSYEGIQSYPSLMPEGPNYPDVISGEYRSSWLSYSDLNFCVILYIVSTALLVVLYLSFHRRKKFSKN